MKGIWEKEITCPVCKNKFMSRNVRSSAYQVAERDADFYTHYEGVNPLHYEVWVCPNCLYAARRVDFSQVSGEAKKKIEELCQKNLSQPKEFDFTKERTPELALEAYKLALSYYKMRPVTSEVRAGVSLRVAWLCRETADVEQERDYLREALEYYIAAFEKGGEVASKLGEVGLTYLIGELYRRLGNYQQAVQWFGRTVMNKAVKLKPEIERLSREQWHAAKEELKLEEEKGLTEPHKDFIPLSLPLISREEIREVEDTLKSGWLTTGPKTEKFEEKFKEYIGCSYALALNSCTAALHLGLVVAGVGREDEVITTPFTFCATANVIVQVGAKPVFVDIREDTYNLDPREIEKKITKKTKAIIPVDYAGQPCDLDEIKEIAKEHNLIVIEDAAHALGSTYRERKIGIISDLTCFSFYATKNITTAEGGMITTENKEWAEKIRLLSLHGMSRDAWKRYKKEGSWYYEVLYPGYKYNLSDVQAALGLHQLESLEKFLQMRKNYANMYSKTFKEMPEIIVPYVEKDLRHSWHLYVIQIKEERLKIGRGEFVESLKKEGIGSGVHFVPLHLQPFYRERYGFKEGDYPVTEKVFKGVISLPLYPAMTLTDVNDVISAVKRVVERNR